MKKLKFVRAWQGYRTGQVVDMDGGKADRLLTMRIAVEDTQGSLIETAAAEHQAETADATKRKRGRPRAVPQPDPPNAPST